MNDKDAIRTPARRRQLLASFGAPGFRPFYAYNTFAAVDMNVRIGVHGWLVLELSDDSAFWVGMFALALGARARWSSRWWRALSSTASSAATCC